jgi:hypothetical protein
LAHDSNPDVAVYVVWSPQRGGEERHVGSAAGLVPDPRAIHYWDPGRLAGRAFGPIVGTDDPAWDVWLLFDRRARWAGVHPPAPSWWEHQLGGLPVERHLDPVRFAEQARALERTP